MRYRINPAGNRIVDATPEETHVLRPRIRAVFRRWRVPPGDIEDFAQDVEIVTWQAIHEQRVPGGGFKRPEDALVDFMFAVAWNLWRNHSRRRSTRSEILHDETPDMASPSPNARLEAREALQRISKRPDIARILLDAVKEVPLTKRAEGAPKSTYGYHLTNARKWARDVEAGRWRKPTQPEPNKPWKRKGKR